MNENVSTSNTMQQHEQTQQMSTFERMKGPSGGFVEKAINLILEAVQVARIQQQDAEVFAGKLHESVGGHFIHAKNSSNYKFDERAMEEILTKFYDVKAFELSPPERFDSLLFALKEANLPAIAHEIKEACRK